MPAPALLPILMALAPALAGLFGGIGAGKSASGDRRESRRRYDLERGDIQARSDSTSKLRDRLNFMLQQRLGMPERRARPPDWSGNQSLGGYDEDELNKRMTTYQYGMGGY